MNTELQITLYFFGALMGYAFFATIVKSIDADTPDWRDLLWSIAGLAALLGALYCLVCGIALVSKS